VKDKKRELPKGWRWVRTGEILELRYGAGLPEHLRKHGDHPVFGSNGIVGYNDNPLTKGQSIIVGRKGSAGAVVWSDVPCWPIDTTYFIDELKTNGHLKYIYHALRFLKLSDLDKSSAVPGLNRDDVYALKIPLPPTIEDQTAIANELEKKMSEVENMRQAALRQKEATSVMGRAILRDVFDFHKDAKWQLIDISEIVDISMGQSPDGATYNKEGIGTPLLNGPTEFGLEHPIPVQWTTAPKKICCAGDLIVCVRGNTTGRMNWADQEYCLGRGVAGIRGKNGKGKTDFIKHALQYKISELLSGCERSTFPNLEKDVLKSFKVFAPKDLRTQERVAESITEKLNSIGFLNGSTNSQLEAIEALSGAILREVFDFEKN
jgi:type I restriction enzyme S subunit